MADDEINVNYDNTTGISTDDGKTNISNNLSLYLYPKIGNITNLDESNTVEFDEEDIDAYSLDVENDKIKIDTTPKLINYLKAYAKKQVSKYIDLVNEIANAKFEEVNSLINSKADVHHNHEIEDINSLTSELSKMKKDITQTSSSELSNINRELSKLDGNLTTLQQQYYKNSIRIKIGRWSDNQGENGTKIVVNYNTGNGIYAKLYCDDPNWDISGKDIILVINGVPYTKTTDSKGKTGKLTINLNPGTYLLTAFIRGDGVMNPAVDQKIIIVE